MVRAGNAARRARHRYGRLSLSLERRIRELCAAYPRNARHIAERRLPSAMLERMRRENALVDDALAESCEEGLRMPMREDLALRRGSMFTQVFFLSESTYKRRKAAAKAAFAKRLAEE